MTEAGTQWIKSKTGEATSFDVAEAEFWLRAFCEAIQKKGENGRPHVLSYKENGIAFDIIKRELLGE